MASFSAGTTFTDGVANDVTAAKLAALVNAATPTSGLIQDRTAETSTAVNDTLLIGDASDSNNLKRMTVANFAGTLPTATITSGTITNLASTTGTIATLNSTTGTITTGVIPTLTSITKITSGTGTAAAPAISPTGDTNTGIFFPAADTIALSEGGAEAMRIDSSGNVGIGTTSATSKLHISGTGSTASNPSTSDTLGATLALQGTTGIGQGAMLMFGATQGYHAAIKGHLTNGANNTVGDLLFCVRNVDTDTTLTEAMRIEGGGNIGIGTANPTSKLFIEQGETSSGITLNTGTIYKGRLHFEHGTNNVVLDANGDVDGRQALGTNNGIGNLAFRTALGSGIGGTGASTEKMRITGGGNVGIGTTSPDTKLHVDQGNTDNGITVSNANGVYKGRVYFDYATNDFVIDSNGDVGARQALGTNNGIGNLAFRTALGSGIGGTGASTEKMRIDSSGNVGIGVSAPVNKLEVVGSFGRGAPVTKTADFSLADTENWLIVNKGSSCTVTLPAASSWTGREFTIKVITAHAVVSATAASVVPRLGGTAGTAILPATDGAWATLVSNGTTWEIMCGS